MSQRGNLYNAKYILTVFLYNPLYVFDCKGKNEE